MWHRAAGSCSPCASIALIQGASCSRILSVSIFSSRRRSFSACWMAAVPISGFSPRCGLSISFSFPASGSRRSFSQSSSGPGSAAFRSNRAMHIFVVTLRCEHTCRYCQVSRQSSAKNEFDMTEESAAQALELAFRSPSPHLKIEFQGGEPLLNFPLVRWIVEEGKRINQDCGKAAHICDRQPTWPCLTMRSLTSVAVRTSTCRRPWMVQRSCTTATGGVPGQDSWERTVDGHQAGPGPAGARPRSAP